MKINKGLERCMLQGLFCLAVLPVYVDCIISQWTFFFSYLIDFHLRHTGEKIVFQFVSNFPRFFLSIIMTFKNKLVFRKKEV